MSELTARQWEAIAHAWRRLGAIPPNDFDQLRDGLADETRALLGADWVALLIGTLDEDPAGPLRGWRAKLVETPHVDTLTFRQMEEAMRRGLYLQDPHTARVVVEAGRTRVVGRLRGEAPPGPTPMRNQLDAWGIKDQLTGIINLTREVEVYVFVTRLGEAPAFSEADQSLLLSFIDGVSVPARHFARSYGMLGPVALTPRQRAVVSLLLRGMSEKDAAAAMGVSASTAHDYIVEAYRRLEVRSRPELIALWLGLR